MREMAWSPDRVAVNLQPVRGADLQRRHSATAPSEGPEAERDVEAASPLRERVVHQVGDEHAARNLAPDGVHRGDLTLGER